MSCATADWFSSLTEVCPVKQMWKGKLFFLPLGLYERQSDPLTPYFISEMITDLRWQTMLIDAYVFLGETVASGSLNTLMILCLVNHKGAGKLAVFWFLSMETWILLGSWSPPWTKALLITEFGSKSAQGGGSKLPCHWCVNCRDAHLDFLFLTDTWCSLTDH